LDCDRNRQPSPKYTIILLNTHPIEKQLQPGFICQSTLQQNLMPRKKQQQKVLSGS